MSKPLRQVPAIPNVEGGPNNVASIGRTVTVLKEGVEILAGHRGADLDRAATLRDLVSLGLTTEAAIKGLS